MIRFAPIRSEKAYQKELFPYRGGNPDIARNPVKLDPPCDLRERKRSVI